MFFVHRALPLGFVAPVTQYNRIYQSIAFLANRVLLIPADSYFDDFWSVEPCSLAESGFHTFGVLSSEILGFELNAQTVNDWFNRSTMAQLSAAMATICFESTLTGFVSSIVHRYNSARVDSGWSHETTLAAHGSNDRRNPVQYRSSVPRVRMHFEVLLDVALPSHCI